MAKVPDRMSAVILSTRTNECSFVFTVYRALHCAAKLKNPSVFSRSEKGCLCACMRMLVGAARRAHAVRHGRAVAFGVADNEERAGLALWQSVLASWHRAGSVAASACK